MTFQNLKLKINLLLTFLLSCLYLIPKGAAHITAGDAGELALAGSTLGIAHSPGYPVFVVIYRLLGGVIYFGNKAFQQNMVSAVVSALTIVVLGWTLVKISNKILLAWVPVVLLFFPRFVHQALVTEVFPLTILWAALLLMSLFGFYRQRQGYYLVALLFGLGVAVHQTLVLFIPGFLAFYIKNKKQPFKNLIQDMGPICLFFGLGLTIHLFIPLRSWADPVLNWEDPGNFSRFWGLITRERYGFFQLSQGDVNRNIDVQSLLNAFAHMKNVLMGNFGFIGITLLVLSSLVSLTRRHHRRIIFVCWISILFSGPVFFWLTNVPADTTSDILDRFSLLPLIPGIIILGVGIELIWDSGVLLNRSFILGSIALFIFEISLRHPPYLAAGPISYFDRYSTRQDHAVRWDLSMRESGLNVLRMIPFKARLFVDRADETEFALGFLLNAEQRRPELIFTDCNAGVTKSIYGDDYYRIWGKPRLKIRTKVEKKILNESQEPVFYATIDPVMIDMYRHPHGFIYEAIPLKKLTAMTDDNEFPWDEILVWNANPSEPRAKMIKQINLQKLAEYLFDQQTPGRAKYVFGLAQRLSGSHRFEQLGYWHQTRRQYAQAREAYWEAIKSGVRTQVVLGNLGNLAERNFQFDEAIEIYKLGIERDPTSLFYLNRMGLAYYRSQQYEKAIPIFKQILERDPSYPKIDRLYKTSLELLEGKNDS